MRFWEGEGRRRATASHNKAYEHVACLDNTDAFSGYRATYTGLLDPIRATFAKPNGVKPALFSASSVGACPNCSGAGVVCIELGFMETVATTCEECEGKRFQDAVRENELGGRDISEVLAMSVAEAEEVFGAGEARTPAAHVILGRLADVAHLLGLLDRLV